MTRAILPLAAAPPAPACSSLRSATSASLWKVSSRMLSACEGRVPIARPQGERAVEVAAQQHMRKQPRGCHWFETQRAYLEAHRADRLE
eukprot:510310-Prymnesium_polylepis.1